MQHSLSFAAIWCGVGDVQCCLFTLCSGTTTKTVAATLPDTAVVHILFVIVYWSLGLLCINLGLSHPCVQKYLHISSLFYSTATWLDITKSGQKWQHLYQIPNRKIWMVGLKKYLFGQFEWLKYFHFSQRIGCLYDGMVQFCPPM